MANDIEIRRDRSPRADIVSDFDRMVDRFFGERLVPFFSDFPTVTRRSLPEVQETDDAFLLCADVPGIPQEAIDISVSGNLLTIRAEHREEESGKEGSGYRRQNRSFYQSFTLPNNVDPDKIEANCENGVLEVMIPKAEEAQPRKVEVGSGKGSFFERLRGKSKQEDKSIDQQDKRH